MVQFLQDLEKLKTLGRLLIGSRPIDEHIDSLKKLGVILKKIQKKNYVIAKVINPKKRLLGSSINFKCKSVATETLLMAALAKGKTILNNAAEEPEIVDLANMLNLMGARIKGAGSEC